MAHRATGLSSAADAPPQEASRATRPATPNAVADADASAVADAVAFSNGPTVPPPGMEEPADDARIPAGTMIADRYRITRVLGEGGMGVVYAAEHVHMRKDVALKVLHADMSANAEVVARFEREAIAAAHIDHPNVAAATDFGRLPDGAFYLVLELLRGASLRAEIARGALAPARALRVLRGIASGVSAAHLKGIIHRDLKPENVMLIDREGDADFVKVLDFGIAKLDASMPSSPGAGGNLLTRAGTVFGTPEYMAPEQAAGDVVDARADLYALGVILLEMLTGKCPFDGNPMSILRQRIFSVGPPDLSGVADPKLRALITRLLEREPQARVQTAAELVTALDDLLGDPSLVQAGSGPVRRGSRASVVTAAAMAPTMFAERSVAPALPSRRWIVTIALAAAVLGAAGFVALAWPSGSDAAKDGAGAGSAAATAEPPPTSTGLEPPPPRGVTTATPEPSAEPATADSAEPSSTKPSGHTGTRAKQRKPRKGGINLNVPSPDKWFK